jgi:hypothetical protein
MAHQHARGLRGVPLAPITVALDEAAEVGVHGWRNSPSPE